MNFAVSSSNQPDSDCLLLPPSINRHHLNKTLYKESASVWSLVFVLRFMCGRCLLRHAKLWCSHPPVILTCDSIRSIFLPHQCAASHSTSPRSQLVPRHAAASDMDRHWWGAAPVWCQLGCVVINWVLEFSDSRDRMHENLLLPTNSQEISCTISILHVLLWGSWINFSELCDKCWYG